MTRKIVFGKTGLFSHTNTSILRQLEEKFPDHEIVVVDVNSMMLTRRWTMFVNMFYVVREYGKCVIQRKKTVQWVRWITSYMFKQMRRVFREHVRAMTGVEFVFQTQSIFDLSVPGLPYFVYTDHTLKANLMYPDYQHLPGEVTSRWHPLEYDIYRHADVVMTMSNHVSRSLIEDYGCPPEKVVRVGVGCNAYSDGQYPDVSRRNSLGNITKNILFVGNNWTLKGGPELVAAFAKVRVHHPDACLTIVGTSPNLSDPGINVVGPVSLAEVKQYFSEATVFCMPTKGDAFGIVFLEAYMNAVPVVALNIGALPDFVENGVTGFLVDYGDVDSLGQALVRLLDDPQMCHEFGLRGREVVLQRYTWDQVGLRIREIFAREMVSRGSIGWEEREEIVE